MVEYYNQTFKQANAKRKPSIACILCYWATLLGAWVIQVAKKMLDDDEELMLEQATTKRSKNTFQENKHHEFKFGI